MLELELGGVVLELEVMPNPAWMYALTALAVSAVFQPLALLCKRAFAMKSAKVPGPPSPAESYVAIVTPALG